MTTAGTSLKKYGANNFNSNFKKFEKIVYEAENYNLHC